MSFITSAGKILNNGTVFKGSGVDVDSELIAHWAGGSPTLNYGMEVGGSLVAGWDPNLATELKAKFPHANLIRIAFEGHYNIGPAAFDAFISGFPGAIITISDYNTSLDGINLGGGNAGQSLPFTGTLLNQQLAWYHDWGVYASTHPNVVIDTANEPGMIAGNPASLGTWVEQQSKAIYGGYIVNGISYTATGYTNALAVSMPYGGDPAYYFGFGASNVTNVVHPYGVVPIVDSYANFMTGTTVANAQTMLHNQVVAAHNVFAGAPVLIGEYGNDVNVGGGSSTGGTNFRNMQVAIDNLINNGEVSGAAAWSINSWDPVYSAMDVWGTGALTGFGVQVATPIFTVTNSTTGVFSVINMTPYPSIPGVDWYGQTPFTSNNGEIVDLLVSKSYIYMDSHITQATITDKAGGNNFMQSDARVTNFDFSNTVTGNDTAMTMLSNFTPGTIYDELKNMFVGDSVRVYGATSMSYGGNTGVPMSGTWWTAGNGSVTARLDLYGVGSASNMTASSGSDAFGAYLQLARTS